MEKMGPKIFTSIFAMIFAFMTFATNTPWWGKTLLKSEKNILQISHLIFWMLQAAKYLTISQISNVIQSYDVYLIISTMMNNDVYTTISAKPINKGNNTSTAVSGTIASIPVGAYLTTSVNTPVPTIVSVPVTWKYLYLYLIRINILILFSLKKSTL